MKRRSIHPVIPDAAAEASLCQALAALQTEQAVQAFLHDLCTPAELEVMTDRWRVVPYLLEKLSYREIHERTGVSITTIGRVSRYLNQGSGGYLAAAAAASRPEASPEKV